MQVNSIGALNTIKSTSFGKKENNKCSSDCAPRDKSMVTIPRVVYAAMLAAVLGGPLTSCEPEDKYIEPDKTEATGNTKAGEVTTPYVVTPEELAAKAPSPVSKKMYSMFSETLGLKITTPINTSLHQHKMKALSLQSGDVTDISLNDGSTSNNSSYKLNQASSTKDTLVYDGSFLNTISGGTGIDRKTVTANDTSLFVKSEYLSEGKYHEYKSMQYVANPDNTVSEYVCQPDGTKEILSIIRPNTETSLIKEYPYNGETAVIDNISIMSKE